MSKSEAIHSELILLENKIYQSCGLHITNIKFEKESIEYGAASFTLGKLNCKFRIGKITPTKVGQFVTFWKRIDNGPILPYDAEDVFDFLIIQAKTDKFHGFFVFPKETLIQKGVLSQNGTGGKRALRIYPSWDATENNQSKKTQAWQLPCFFENIADCTLFF